MQPMRSKTPPLYFRRPDGSNVPAHVIANQPGYQYQPRQNPAQSTMYNMTGMPSTSAAPFSAYPNQGQRGTTPYGTTGAAAAPPPPPQQNHAVNATLNAAQPVPAAPTPGSAPVRHEHPYSAPMPPYQRSSAGGVGVGVPQRVYPQAVPSGVDGWARLSTQSVPSVINPFGSVPYTMGTPQRPTPTNMAAGTPRMPADFLRDTGSSWTSSSAVEDVNARLDAEDATLVLEEQQLRSQLSQLQQWRQRLDEEQQRYSRGWAEMVEQETRYYTEPVIDLSGEISEKELQCATLADDLHNAQSHLGILQAQLNEFAYIAQEKADVQEECARLTNGFQLVETRRLACVAKAERHFDAESKRELAAASHVRHLECRIHELTTNGPLADMMSTHRQDTRSASRSSRPTSVKFVSVDGASTRMPEMNRNTAHKEVFNAVETPASMTSASYGSAGVTASEWIGSPNEEWSAPVGRNEDGANEYGAEASICLGLDDDSFCMGGNSIAFSLNNLKRPRHELTTA